MNLRCGLLLAMLGSIGAVAQSTNTSLPPTLDQYIKKGMADWQVPGLAIVVVKDGQTLLLKGYGVKDISTKAPVDENTHFFIASNSKLFTGVALANLEQQGKLNLNDPVTNYFPDYRLYDSLSTRLVSIRDLLSHRIGTKTFQGDFTFWNTTLTRSQIMQRMRLLQPSAVFRQDYGYCNSCFMTAGEVIPKVTGLSWEQYVQDSLLNRLGMTNSFALSNGIENRSQNIATPYTTSYTGQLNTVPYDRWDNLGPAASIVSNVKDLRQWLLCQLDSGRLQGRQLLPWATLRKTRMINVMTNSTRSRVFPSNFTGYGLGLFAADYNGHQVYWHTGGAAGMVSNVCFVPDQRLGIAILTNNDNQSFFEALRYQLLDHFLNVPYSNRSEAFLAGFKAELQQQLDEIAGWRKRAGKAGAPPQPLARYAGTYQHPLYGLLHLIEKDDLLQVRFPLHPGMTATLQYIGQDEWLLEYSNIEYGLFATRFRSNAQGRLVLSLPMNPFVEMDAYDFEKQ
ncbi:MAG: serine hydrolase [Chitinophagaceae bacterium]|nr:serine hydrolase [Chitinophagaceae bacterium]